MLLTHSTHECASNAVKTLLECGADPNLTDKNGWTPWMASTLVDGPKRSRIPDALLQFGANKTGDHIVKKLMEWDGKYGVTVRDAAGDSLTIEFSSLPENLDDFNSEILILCPNAADNERDLLEQLRKSKKLFLWWD